MLQVNYIEFVTLTHFLELGIWYITYLFVKHSVKADIDCSEMFIWLIITFMFLYIV